MSHIDPEVRKLALEYIARVKTGRGVLAVRAMLKAGSVTTEDLVGSA